MSLQPSSRHPLASRPSSPLASQPASSAPYHGVPSQSGSYLLPIANATPGPSRSPSPGVMATRRRKANNAAAVDEASAGQGSQIDDYDPKRRPANAAGVTPPKPANALDRLESLFGIDSSKDSEYVHAQNAASLSLRPEKQRQKPPTGSPGTRLVLQHVVLANDTLAGLALRYKTDVPTLRRVNGLWPGDSALSRKILWVPLDKCKDVGLDGETKLGIQGTEGGQITETSASSLGLLSSTPSGSTTPSSTPHVHDRTFSSTASVSEVSEVGSSISSRAASTSAAAQPVPAPPVVRRLPSEVLGHFPAAPRSEVVAKGKVRADEWDKEIAALRPQHRLGPGPGMSGYDPGESGLEDLLQLARKARTSGEEAGPDAATSSTADDDGPAQTVPDSTEITSDPATATAVEWKPNVWKFGERKSKEEEESRQASFDSPRASNETWQTHTLSSNGSASGSANGTLRPLKLVERSIEEWEASSSALHPTKNQEPGSSSYNGWNDIPSLQAYAKGKVVEAYGGPSSSGAKSAHKKRAARAHHTFFDDLAAGLPPNTGVASKWARPIKDSVPIPGAQSSAGSDPAAAPTSKVSSLRSLLSDTLRGRVALDEALAKGFDEVMSRGQEWNTLPQEEMEHARRLGLLPPSTPPSGYGNGNRYGQHTQQHKQHQATAQRAGANASPLRSARLSAEEASRSLGRVSGRMTGGGAGSRVGASSESPSPPPPLTPVPDGSSAAAPGHVAGSSGAACGVGRRRSQHEMMNLTEGGGADEGPHFVTEGVRTAGPRPGVRRQPSGIGGVARGGPQQGNGIADQESKWGW